MIRSVKASDAAQIAEIYNHYIQNTVITFEEQPLEAAELAERMLKVTEAFPWLVAAEDERILGYAYAGTWRTRSAYRLSVECGIYLHKDECGRGLGSALYSELLGLLAARGFHAVLGGVTLPNDPSVALHEKFGFEKVAHFKEVGLKFGRWHDVGFWERRL